MTCIIRLLAAEKPLRVGQEGAFYLYWDFETKQLIGADEPTNYRTLPESCSNDLYIAWQNNEGGIDRWVFRGKHEYTGEVSGGVLYRDSNNAERLADRGTAKHGYTIYTGKVSKADALYLRGLREAQAVWMLPVGIDGDWIDVYVVEGSYNDYKMGEVTNVSVQIIVSQLIDTQRE